MKPKLSTLDAYAQLFEDHGGTDQPYLAHHYWRFVSTLQEFCSTWSESRGMRTLDIGAHWLHQSVLWSKAGFDVAALDMPITFEMPHVRAIANSYGIELTSTPNLETALEFDRFADSSFDVILFTEIFEHLTFNPVKFWKQVHRVLSPGGRIVLTTPNYYAWNGRAWSFKRFLSGFGGGISVDDILNTNTHAHHWREFSLHEVIRYFCILSPDFNTVKAKRVRDYYPKSNRLSTRFGHALWEKFPALRPNLHLEIELSKKEHGIVVKPGW